MNAAGDLGRLQRSATFFIVSFALLASLVLLITAHYGWIPSLISGAFVALVNLVWLIAPARRFVEAGRVVSGLRLTALLRYGGIGALLGFVLILGRAHAIAALVGYSLLPLSLMAAGYRIFARSGE